MAEGDLRRALETIGALRAEADRARQHGDLEAAARLLYTELAAVEREADELCHYCGSKDSSLEKGDWMLESGIQFPGYHRGTFDRAGFHRACARKLAMDLVFLLAGTGPRPPQLT